MAQVPLQKSRWTPHVQDVVEAGRVRELSAGHGPQCLADFLAEVSAQVDEAAAREFALEQVSTIFQATVALVSRHQVEQTHGWSPGAAPIAELIKVSAAGRGQLRTEAGDSAEATIVTVDGRRSSALVVARLAPGAFSEDEVALLRGMGRGLGV